MEIDKLYLTCVLINFYLLGAFICIYVGNLFESEQGNLQGQNFGDEYFAQLDLIEIVESRKVSDSL